MKHYSNVNSCGSVFLNAKFYMTRIKLDKNTEINEN